MAAIMLGAVCAGCSMSYQLDTIFAKADKAEPETTGSIAGAVALPPEADLNIARRAAYEVLSRGSKDASVPWENPQNGAHGTVTPLGTDYRADGLICRDFLASHVTPDNEAWMQGEACRASSSRTAKWEIRALKPWRRT
jgi:surface antigen